MGRRRVFYGGGYRVDICLGVDKGIYQDHIMWISQNRILKYLKIVLSSSDTAK